MKLNIPVGVQTGPAPAYEAAAHNHADGSHGSVPGPAPVFVTVAGQPISELDIAQEMQHHRAMRPEQARADAARALVVRTLLQREVSRLALLDQIEPEGAETQEEAAIRLLIDREIITPVPTEADCRRYYEANPERMRSASRAQVRHILLAAAPADIRAREKMRKLGEQLIAQLRGAPERFAELAQLHSACPSREEGGSLGWIEAGDTVPEFERQVFRLQPGLAGLTVESRYGHHLVMLDDLQPGSALDFADCQARVAAYLEAQVKQNAIHQYLSILADRHEVRGLNALEAA